MKTLLLSYVKVAESSVLNASSVTVSESSSVEGIVMFRKFVGVSVFPSSVIDGQVPVRKVPEVIEEVQD